MSDDEDESAVLAAKKAKIVRFGSLADQKTLERIREQDDQMETDDTGPSGSTKMEEEGGIRIGSPSTSEESSAVPSASASAAAAKESGKEDSSNVNVSGEYLQLDKIVDPHKAAVMAEFERRRRARTMTLPTDDLEVKMLLRRMDHPICLFGEEKPERRERLRALLSELDQEEIQEVLHPSGEETKREGPNDEETWYHEGPASLKEARVFLAKYSLPRAKRRLEKARETMNEGSQIRAMKLQEAHKWVRGVTIYGSQIGDNRPISYCEFSPNSQYIATASWSGLCKVWTIPQCKQVRTLRGHNTNSGCVRFHPQSTISLDPSLLNLASCAHDGSVLLWSLESDEPIADLQGHGARVSRLAFHPSGRFLATCCHDHSWRLFDLEVNDEVLFQEGHSKPVFDIDFQCDGSVALTGGMDSYGRVWDLRTGRCIMFLEGHQKEILTVGFSPNGHHMATGSSDNTVKMWDLRMRRSIYTIPAHKSLVSKLKFDGGSGLYLVTGSYDNTIKMWTHPGWQQLKVLSGHDSKVMCVDISPGGKWLASSSFDRTFKLWGPEI